MRSIVYHYRNRPFACQVCRYHLAPHLSTMANDKTLLEQSNDKPQPSPRTPSLHEHQDPLVKQEPATTASTTPTTAATNGTLLICDFHFINLA